jgi:hypothetical protein
LAGACARFAASAALEVDIAKADQAQPSNNDTTQKENVESKLDGVTSVDKQFQAVELHFKTGKSCKLAHCRTCTGGLRHK